ncbi:unnamed protein product [Cyprideis torosa]|uniref:Uncharacterized protein n=1 Tax=Cyprideis torosa TaxID=163714 RepID=A0A7R8ZKH7_9CRUS|nr:unnamed protein product [Cyprideis torosa]CAG0890974.1 unnamed protein product [Cyprideis torosa]
MADSLVTPLAPSVPIPTFFKPVVPPRVTMQVFLWVLVLGLSSTTSANHLHNSRDVLGGENEEPLSLICPAGFFLLGRSCYAFDDIRNSTWDDAQTYCQGLALGGKLIEMETAEEFYLITTYLRENPHQYCSTHNYWTGAQQREDSQYYEWATTRWPLLFYNWRYDEPSYPYSGNAIVLDCSDDWQWRNAQKTASGTLYKLCEAPSTEVALSSELTNQK